MTDLALTRTQLTYRYDRLRAIPQGVIETASTTFLLLIAVKAFDAGPTPKSLIAAAGNIGLLLSLWLVPLVERSGRPVMRIAAWMMAGGALAMLGAAIVPTLVVLVMATVIAVGAANAIIPLLTAVYQDNYAPRERGRYVARTLVIRVAAAAVFAELAGRLLTADIARFRWLLVAFAVAFAAAAYCLSRIPSRALHGAPPEQRSNFPIRLGIVSRGAFLGAFDSLKVLRTDRTLRWTLASWMLMGFANLMMWPLRVEFLANPKYGLTLDPQQIALYTVMIPSVARLALTPLWGRLFDRMNFFLLRIILNVGFALGIASFFTGAGALGLATGAVIFGAANAGGEIAWSLWVTKFAPEDRVAEYMSIHTFFTGVRGIAAPILAFQLTQTLDIGAIALICAALILLASLILVPEMKGRAPA
ncbi:MAG: hypothetical protein KatS3mg053_1196 [Candidatus Roseilinea sp.]|nr:MAG: hypothetical protein KatS3mg053_1196 [Candidatus Roseilinea sp.]